MKTIIERHYHDEFEPCHSIEIEINNEEMMIHAGSILTISINRNQFEPEMTTGHFMELNLKDLDELIEALKSQRKLLKGGRHER